MQYVSDQVVDNACRKYGECKPYASYSEEDHQTWRTALQHIVRAQSTRCVIPLNDALISCGISKEFIPDQGTIDRNLSKLGWGSLMVKTFIPAREFMQLQARQILPITAQIRSPHQLGYTPIPDVIHEVVGHLPMLTIERYRSFLRRLGEIGSSLRFSRIDQVHYELETKLAQAKSSPKVDTSQTLELESELQTVKSLQRKEGSPGCLLSRFHWWTVEYGLIGDCQKIFGAGLLSSASEAIESDGTPKERLSLDCMNQNYEITDMQPKLFVADDWDHLEAELDRLETVLN